MPGLLLEGKPGALAPAGHLELSPGEFAHFLGTLAASFLSFCGCFWPWPLHFGVLISVPAKLRHGTRACWSHRYPLAALDCSIPMEHVTR